MSQVKEVEIGQLHLSVLLQILESAPDPYLILSPDLKIQVVTEAYLKATLSKRENLIGKDVFEAFPDNPATPEANAVKNLRASFLKVLKTKQPHQMPTQHYDVPRPLEKGGGFEEKHWNPVNCPVLNEAGEVSYIIHKVTDVTALVNKQEEVKDLTQERNALQVGLDLSQNIQQKLREEERRLKEAQAIGHIGSFESTLPEGEVVWSDEMYRIFGLVPQSEPVSFEKFFSFVHPDDKASFDRAMQVFYLEQANFNLTYRIIRADKQTRVVHTLATVYSGADGQVRVHGTVQDITEQKLAQEKLEANEALLRQAEAVGQIGSYEADAATMVFRFSDEMYRILGHEPGTVEPTLDWINSITFPEDVEPITRQMLHALEKRQPYHYIRRIYWPNGQLRYIEGKGRIICDEHGNPIKYLGTVLDITDQVRTDLILNTINEVCFELDEQLRFKYANRKAYEAWRKKPEEVLGKNYSEVLPDYMDSDISELIYTAVERKEQVLQRVYSPTDERWYFYNVMPALTGLIVLYFDVTDRVEARREIKQQQEHFQMLIENMPDLISRWNKDVVLVYCNANFENKLELGPSGGLGKTNLEMGLPLGVALPFTKSLQKVFSSGQPQDHSCDIQTADGWVNLLARLVPEFAPDGTVNTVLSLARDITQVKRAQVEIAKHLRILQQSEELVGMGSWEYDITSDTFTWSEGMGQLLQVGQGEGQWTDILLNYVQEEDQYKARLIIDSLQSDPRPFDETLRLQLEQGVKVLRVKGTVISGPDGSPAKVLGVNWDITEMQRLEDENLRIKLDQQKELALAILNTQDAERRRIAEGLHNGIAQLLYAAKLNLGQVLEDENVTRTPLLAESVSKADVILGKAIQQTRSLSHELIPTPLSDFGLEAALKDICSTLNNTHLTLRCWVFNLHTPLEKHLELVVYRIAQELANNVVKHAQATQAGIILREQRGALVLEVEDNGKGFAPDKITSRGIGLKSIHDRVKLLNGTMDIDSVPGQGTTVSIFLPLANAQTTKQASR